MGNCTSAPGVVAGDDEFDDHAIGCGDGGIGGAGPNASCLAPGSEHVITRFKNQDVAALATKYMPKDAVTALAAPSAPAQLLSAAPVPPPLSSNARNLISLTPAAALAPAPASAPSTPVHSSTLASGFVLPSQPPLALGALGDDSLDDEPGARTVRALFFLFFILPKKMRD